MSIKSDVTELEQLTKEIKRLCSQTKKLREQKRTTEERIIKYLTAKGEPGIKYSGSTIKLETKEKRNRLDKTSSKERAINLLRDRGVDNPEEVYEGMMEARRGDLIEKDSLAVKWSSN